jgi:hypothetical protein
VTARALLVLLALVGSACGSGGRPPSPDPDRESVRVAVVGFLDALAGRDDAPALSSAVRGPLLEDWAAWLDRERPGQAGAVEIRALRVAALDGDVARVDLDATVTIGRTGPDARVAEEEITLEGPMALVRDGEGLGWLVTDLVREGRAMSLAVTIFDPPVRGAAGGVEVEVRSLYRFGTGTIADLRITNGSEEGIGVDRPPTRIQAAGRFVGATAAPGAFLEDILPGATPEGSVTFHAVPLRWLPEKLMVHLVDGAVVTVDLPAEAFIRAATEA